MADEGWFVVVVVVVVVVVMVGRYWAIPDRYEGSEVCPLGIGGLGGGFCYCCIVL
jgi:hypothetical protein